jgi:addiction module RelB/DinJ family antitoxin
MPAKEAVVRSRVDEKLKKGSEAILRRHGVTPTEAIRMFFTQITLRQGLPFAVTVNGTENDNLLLPTAKRKAAIDSVYDSFA